ncbi:MAG: hypothetical protein A3E21_05140 [Sulfurimonas sp. RIFCSPHIGHO2_12_FULL_36_9]|uniref:CiaD-like domain-containing protein n=1 Tax=Sulfurimonas sp. RIFCSPLOWO2_12_36_12 TaxID=1802253 RepID=UPI0008CFAAFF|nr:hypothetical protein [Sulfurimonas sp. RIFCSPLOWO2_12_36_12]OHD96811.1 MAG: hypothetical protein A3E21_05140 [Sulfurimonas sp. RIFCSPHIGHO2_12_FULL_36_9]OHD99909.1 MAG: hypothetical protein A3J26_06550 [Sulfurimonas sp. RIFCSPLOWO2_02_FULL_36_28]OHE01870.1 MAG: hypothetical protein A2W82_08805 [Sulfurimonas sp. RIFCSPLOWO2_12_36_12]OHE05957.1 MAG: hypothetical protein A3K14_09015 [Sulfurimonas sp. RIFCSPLOWO2_12_FULL_36_74]
MELKDVILSTLAELEDIKPNVDDQKTVIDFTPIVKKESKIEIFIEEEPVISNEMMFLTSMRERLLVLFEGFQAPNNTNIEAKVDMTLNFLEYTLVSIDSRVEELERGNRK